MPPSEAEPQGLRRSLARNRAVRLARDARWIAAAAAVAAAAVGFGWGTYVAGGSDSYCYLSQAELFATGHIVNIQPIASIAPWEHAAKAFVPNGHVSAFSPVGATVPKCPPGYPMLMAVARTVGGRPAMFAVVPLLGALAVWSTFVLGRRIAGLATWEQPEFVEQFESTSPLGGLGWPPMVDINHEVRIYEADDYARYRSGIPVRTDRIWTRRRDQISIFLRDKTEIQK
jgi:hypothetical protein